MQPKSILRAKFKGRDKSLGYRNGETYLLMTWFAKKNIFSDPYLFVKRPMIDSSLCPYQTIGDFLNNWEIKND